MFQAVQYVTGGLSLVAFVVAAFLYAYRARLRNHIETIKSVPEGQRLAAVATAAEFFQVDVSQLPPEQRYSIVLEELHIKSRRDWLLFLFAIVIAIVCAIIALVAVRGGPNPPVPKPIPDSKASKPENPATRINSFTVTIPNMPTGESGLRQWVRKGDRWEEGNGRVMNHKIEDRISLNSCDGTKSKKEEDAGLEFFIPELGCPGMTAMFRRDGGPWHPWLPMSRINESN